jgi:hypothetical protein
MVAHEAQIRHGARQRTDHVQVELPYTRHTCHA